jgi:hypothetical protein
MSPSDKKVVCVYGYQDLPGLVSSFPGHRAQASLFSNGLILYWKSSLKLVSCKNGPV